MDHFCVSGLPQVQVWLVDSRIFTVVSFHRFLCIFLGLLQAALENTSSISLAGWMRLSRMFSLSWRTNFAEFVHTCSVLLLPPCFVLQMSIIWWPKTPTHCFNKQTSLTLTLEYVLKMIWPMKVLSLPHLSPLASPSLIASVQIYIPTVPVVNHGFHIRCVTFGST